MRTAAANPLSQRSDGHTEGVRMFCHTSIIGSDPHKSSPTHLDTLSYRAQHCVMDKLFPKRTIFRDAVNAYRKSHSITREQVAAMLDLQDGGLRCLMYDKRTGVSLDTLQKAAEIFHRPITDFVDDPGSPQGDIDAAAWADATPRDHLATAIGAGRYHAPLGGGILGVVTSPTRSKWRPTYQELLNTIDEMTWAVVLFEVETLKRMKS